jgi:hypothetical protein
MPFAYHAYALKIGIPRKARNRAKVDWQQNTAMLYIEKSDPRYDAIVHACLGGGTRDPATGVLIWPNIPFGRRAAPALRQEDTIWRDAYNQQVRDMIRRHGGLRIRKGVLSYSSIRDLLHDPRLKPLPSTGLTHGTLTVEPSGYGGNYDVIPSAHYSRQIGVNVRYMTLPDMGNLLVLVDDNSIYTYLPSGEEVQVVSFYEYIDDLIEAFE